MKKRIELVFSLMIICLAIFGISSNVYGQTGVPTIGATKDMGIKIKDGSSYTSHYITVNIGGKNYEAYCLDPGLRLSRTNSLTCTALNDQGLINIMQSGYDYHIKQLAVRMYAIYNNYVIDEKMSTTRESIVLFLESNGNTQYLNGPGVKEAYALANANRYASSNSSNSYKSISTQRISVVGSPIIDTGAKTITYNIKSNENMSLQAANFKTSKGSLSLLDWNGTSGKIVISALQCNDEVVLEVIGLGTSDSGNAYICDLNGSIEVQGVVVDVKTGLVTDGPSSSTSTPSPNNSYVLARDKFDCTPSPTCCNESRPDPNDVRGPFNNCCEDTTSTKLSLPDLNELFCVDPDTHKIAYTKECLASNFLEKRSGLTNSSYCELYCTESIEMQQPNPITAISGRYFKLERYQAKNGNYIKSPYLEGHKECRLWIDYTKFHTTVTTNVNDQVDAYNKYQENYAYYQLYRKAVADAEEKKVKISGKCSAGISYAISNVSKSGETITYNSDTDTCTTANVTQPSSSPIPTVGNYDSGVITYHKYNLKKAQEAYPDFYTADYNHNENSHGNISIVAGRTTKHTKVDNEVVVSSKLSEKIREANLYVNGNNGGYYAAKSYKCSRGTGSNKITFDMTSSYSMSCSLSKSELTREYKNGRWVESWKDVEEFSDSELPSMDVESKRDSKKTAANRAKSNIGTYETNINNAINELSICTNYWTKTAVENKNQIYDMSGTTTKFIYTQVYLDEKGNKKSDYQTILFGEESESEYPNQKYGCTEPSVKSVPLTSPDGGYSDVYKNGSENIVFIKNSDLKEANDTITDKPQKISSSILNNKYADKTHLSQGEFDISCQWSDKDNTVYTLIPTGEATSDVENSTFNYTVHNREYRVYLSTLRGKYDTYWQFSGIGSRDEAGNARFDNYINNNSKTCDKKNAPAGRALSCTIFIEREIVDTGECNPDGVTVDPDSCDDFKDGIPSFNFRTVDPEHIFPNDVKKVSGKTYHEYAYNWLDTVEGPEVQKEIEETAKAGKTYAPEKMTYSFILTPSDMRLIKTYNSEKNGEQGGYSDFDLKCDCNNKNGPCVKCKSSFLENLAGGHINLEGKEEKVTGWTNNNMRFDEVRTRVLGG